MNNELMNEGTAVAEVMTMNDGTDLTELVARIDKYKVGETQWMVAYDKDDMVLGYTHFMNGISINRYWILEWEQCQMMEDMMKQDIGYHEMGRQNGTLASQQTDEG